jgi:hypothetical protein
LLYRLRLGGVVYEKLHLVNYTSVTYVGVVKLTP